MADFSVRTRIAPSPTGYPHIGTIYQALFDFAFAKKHKGKFIIRIEDTDRERFVPDAEEKLYAAIDWFGLSEDESSRKDGPHKPYRQSERLDIYKWHATELIRKGGAYHCFCTKERLEGVRKKQQEDKKPMMYDRCCANLTAKDLQQKLTAGTPHVIRLRVPQEKEIVVRDQIRGDISFKPSLIEDGVLVKSDGYPTYHLAATVDDHLMEITHVVRGEEWLSSLPKHWLLYEYFGWEKPKFYHTPVLRNPDKSKLSKRHGHTSVSWYQEEGFLPEAILNFLTLMGWSHPQGKEIFSLDEFMGFFDLKDIKPVGPIFDLTKLQWMNGHYMREKGDEELLHLLIKFDPSLKTKDETILLQLITLAKTRVKTLRQLQQTITDFLDPEKITLANEERVIANDLRNQLSSIQEWNSDNILLVLKQVMLKHGVRMPVLYKIITGSQSGLPLPQTLELLGKEKVLERL